MQLNKNNELKRKIMETIKKQLANNLIILNKMSPVVDLKMEDFTGIDRSVKKSRISAEYGKFGHAVYRENYGRIDLRDREVSQSLSYLNSDAEYAAFFAVPRVLKQGIVISEHSNHKGRNYSTVTFAAPVVINRVRGNVAVVVKETGKNHYKTHRIISTEGQVYIIHEIKKEATNFGVATGRDSKGPNITSPTDNLTSNNKKSNMFFKDSRKTINNKRGSSAVLSAMIFVAFALCIAGSIKICRELVIKSECEAFGRVWTRAVLSEYDLPLLEDYGLMAYFGNDSDISEKLENYMDYSMADRLDIDLGGANADLIGYELGDPDNFSEALKKSLTAKVIGDIVNGGGRRERTEKIGTEDTGSEEAVEGSAGDSGGGRCIKNKVVLDTLPSGGIRSSYDIDSLVQRAKNFGSEGGLKNALANAGSEVIFIEKFFDNAVTYATDKDSYFRNEWEYVINGSPDDGDNLRSVKRSVFLMRNALNLLSLYKDPQKVELIISVAESITPGPLGLATQILIAEAWALIETEQDMKDLLDGGRVPILKSAEEWQTGLGAVLDSSKVKEKLDDESRELLDENRGELGNLPGITDRIKEIKEGLNYDEHLMILILAMDERVRLLRIMDLIQINMKYRYYRDFNMMEYYVGTRFSLEANGRSYEFEDEYK